MSSHKRLKFFAGSSHPELAKELAKKLKVKLSPQEMKSFSNGEIYFRPLESVRGADVFILQTASANVNQDLMELFIMLDSLKRSFAHSVHVVMPHYGYARQDRVAAPREPISAKLMADLISKSGADHLITMSLHSGQTQGFFDFPVDNIHTHKIFHDYFAKKKLKNAVVVSPDAGGGKAAKRLADPLGVKIAIISKSRPEHNKAEAMSVVGDVKGKTCILFDDMIDTGGSVAAAHEALLKAGADKAIYLAATHAVFSGHCIERLKKAKFKEVVVTNTIAISKEQMFPGLKVLSVASILGQAITRIYEGRSVSGIWE